MWEEERLHEVFYIKRLRLSLRQCVKKTGIEFKSDDDKVDIALEENSKIFKSIQVKSTINTFSKNSLEKWLQDLINDDVGANEFELFLIGQCNNDALTFINSIDKHRLTRAHREKQLKMSCQALHNAPPNRT